MNGMFSGAADSIATTAWSLPAEGSCRLSQTLAKELIFPMTARNLIATCLTTVLLGLAPGRINVAAAADAAAGEAIAKRWCVSCHAVSAAPQKVATEAATFVEIARRPDFNEKTLAYFLLDPHPKMPDMNLTRIEAANLAAYVHALQK